jgi:hypothetical protein
MAEQTYSQEQMGKILGILNSMVERAMRDPEFRKLSLDDFSAAFKQTTGVNLPERAQIRFVEAGQGDLENGLVELPSVSEELTDEDLERVAGGAAGPASPLAGLFDPSLVMIAYAAPPSVWPWGKM